MVLDESRIADVEGGYRFPWAELEGSKYLIFSLQKKWCKITTAVGGKIVAAQDGNCHLHVSLLGISGLF